MGLPDSQSLLGYLAKCENKTALRKDRLREKEEKVARKQEEKKERERKYTGEKLD